MRTKAERPRSAGFEADRIALERMDRAPNEVVARYNANYGLTVDDGVTIEMVRQHWLLERMLVEQMRATAPETRPVIFAEAYGRLYRECPWLNRPGMEQGAVSELSHFPRLLDGASSVYEIGSGTGRLIRLLARNGFDCVASEVTAERGGRPGGGDDGVQWRRSDGIHLVLAEPERQYDAAIAVQLIEHLHPGDLVEHFRNVARILKPSGFYLLETPHVLNGPADLSRVFGLSVPVCMHLKEYTYAELVAALSKASFRSVRAVYLPPRKFRRFVDLCFASRAYLHFCLAVERLALCLPRWLRAAPLKALRLLGLWRPDILIKASV